MHAFEAFGEFRHLNIPRILCDPKENATFLRLARSAAPTNGSLCRCKLTAPPDKARFDPGKHQALSAVAIEVNGEMFRQSFDRR